MTTVRSVTPHTDPATRRACTIIARNYLAQARVLAASFAHHHGGERCVVLLLDDLNETIGPDEPFDVVRPSDVMPTKEFARMATMYTVVELATAMKPFLLAWLLGQGATSVAYFDPDIRVFTSLPEVFEAAEEAGVALTPHALEPLPRGGVTTQPEDVILDVGVFNLGFIAVGSGTPALAWWADHLARECVIDPRHGRFVDQRWVDLFIGYFAPAVLRDPGMNVAWWNLATRHVTTDDDGYRVDGVPLRFFHFSGYDPDMPWLVSRHQGPLPRVLMAGQPALQRITQEYGAALHEAGHSDWSVMPYALGATPAGVVLTAHMRTLYRDALLASEREEGDEPPNPFADGDVAFAAWLAAADPDASGSHPAGRYGHRLWTDSVALRERFPDVHGADAGGFAEWLRNDPSVPAAIAAAAVPLAPAPPGALEPGIHVIGMLNADRTEGEVARRIASQALDAGIPVETTTVSRLTGPATCQGDERAHPCDATLNVIVMPPDRIGEANHLIGPAKRVGRRTVGVIVDLEQPLTSIPNTAEGLMDEIWVLSTAGQTALAGIPECPPVHVMPPMPLAAPAAAASARQITCVIDAAAAGAVPHARSVVDAFAALPTPNSAHLTVGVVHADHDGQLVELLHYLTDGDPHSKVMELTLLTAQNLMARADALAWLPQHGDSALAVMDALASGIPVVATDTGQVHDMPECYGLIKVSLTATPAEVGTALARALVIGAYPPCAADGAAAFLTDAVARALPTTASTTSWRFRRVRANG